LLFYGNLRASAALEQDTIMPQESFVVSRKEYIMHVLTFMYNRLSRQNAIQCCSDNYFLLSTKYKRYGSVLFISLFKKGTIAGCLGLKLVLFYYFDTTAKERIYKKCYVRKIKPINQHIKSSFVECCPNFFLNRF
jgi:hypothetical protein